MAAELATAEIEAKLSNTEPAAWLEIMAPIAGDPAGKNLLSIEQFSADDIRLYIAEAYAAEALINNPKRRGINLLSHTELKAVMRQPSTRTGGSMMTAMHKLGGNVGLISGMESSSEAKGESLADSWITYGTQTGIIGTRTAEDFGPHFAALCLAEAVKNGKAKRAAPIINLGDGKNEHPTQALGDMFTIDKHFGQFEGLTAVTVGDQERYRAFHSFMLAAVKLGMTVVAVESPIAPVPDRLADLLGDKLERTNDLDAAMRQADVLYMGRMPDEFTDKENPVEVARSQRLAEDYNHWIVDYDRLQLLPKWAMLMHPRPRRIELDPSVDVDPRAKDIEQMENMIPMRMAILAQHLGESIVKAAKRPRLVQAVRDLALR